MIGVEYLYNQTGEILKDNTVEEEDLRHGEEALSDINQDQIDEGFDEDEDETIALAEQVFTLPLGSDRDSDATSTSDEDSAELVGGDSSCATEDSSGPDNIQGYGEVQALASYLVSIGEGNMALSNSQANEIIRLWKSLHEYDKQPTTFAPRHRTTLVKGKFKVPKRRNTNVVPGLDSTRRCFLGSNSAPAQWPDCNRYTEAVISELCNAHPGPERSSKKTSNRWSLVCKDYRGIQERVMNNGMVMRETQIQLPDINQATLSQWYI
ncbi:uncharacterized protein LOC111319705, partial [Stylophora pistillata]|uniref:uncharacterized protein LOC111319705 n=1 Tax=Stylophora pistillata TaxID=50429 RepID=UPI000C056410